MLNNEGAWAAASLIIYADFGVELKQTIDMGLDTERFGFVPIPTCKNLKTDIIPSLQAGASFKARVFIFTGGLAADLRLYSKFLLEILQVDRKDVKEWGYYLAFMGLGVKWSVSGSIGIELQTEKEDEGGLRSGDRTSTSVGNLEYENEEDTVLMGKNKGNSSFEGTEWHEFEKRDREIAKLLKQIEALESERKRLNVPTTMASFGIFSVSWKTSERNKTLRELRKHIKELERRKKEYEELQEKTDTTKIWGSSILAYHNLNAEELTKIRKDNNINSVAM